MQGGGVPNIFLQSLHLGLDQAAHARVKFLKRLNVGGVGDLPPAHRQRQEMGRDLVPFGEIAREGAGDAAIDGFILQGRHDFAEGHRHRRGAKCRHQFGLRTATHTHLLAFHVGQAFDFGIAIDHLRRIGRNAEKFHAKFFAKQFFVHWLGRFGDLA